MEVEEIENNVKNFILEQKKPAYQTSNRKEIRVRCPYCGDSQKNRNDAHFYIEMKIPFKFYCQRCNTGGILTQDTLKDLEIFDSSLSVSLIEGKKISRKLSGIKKIEAAPFKKKINNKTDTLSKYIKNNIFMDENDFSLLFKTTNYFNERFKTSFSKEYLEEKFKCILSPFNFFKKNNIFTDLSKYNFNEAIGFLSSDNSYAIFRDISNLQKTRYYNLNIFPYENGSINSKIYNIHSDINVLEEKVNLIITEGIFDIIGVFIHFYLGKEEEKNTIFAAACGKSFLAVIQNFVRLGFLDFNLIIYSDADVSINFYKNLKNSSVYLRNMPITIFFNIKEKDFGVSKDKISLKKVVI